MGRKTLGILDIVAGGGILWTLNWLRVHGIVRFEATDLTGMTMLIIVLTVAGVSLADGILVLFVPHRKRRVLGVLATVNLILAWVLLFIIGGLAVFFFLDRS